MYSLFDRNADAERLEQVSVLRLAGCRHVPASTFLRTRWNQLDKHSQRATLPTILTRAVFQMSATEITLDLVEGAAKIIGESIEVECE